MSPEKPILELERPLETRITDPNQLSDMGTVAISGTEFEAIEPSPKDYQQRCLDVLKKARDKGEKRALVSMATGLGKTWIAGFDAKRVLEEKPDARILFLAHQNEILNQAAQTFTQIIGEHSQGFFHGGDKEYGEVTTLFASFQAMADWHQAFLSDEFDYVVIDESHHSHAPTYRPVVEYFEPEFLLAITATPDRHDMRDIRQLFGKEKFDLPLELALAKGYLARVDYEIITDEIQELEKIKMANGQVRTVNELNRTLFIPRRDEEIARICKEKATERDEPVKRIIFCRSIGHTEKMSEFFDNASALHSKLTPAEQQARIQAFRNGELETLLVVDMFNEGIDIPEANQIVFLRSTQSKTIFLQQLGRGLRKTENKEKVQVLDFVANAERLIYINEVWQRVAEYQRQLSEQDHEHTQVDTGDIYFDETAVNILDLLAEIKNRYTRDSMVVQLQRLAEQMGRTPTSTDITQASKQNMTASLTMFQRVFGSWNEALVQAGFAPNMRQRVTKDQMIDELMRLADQLGRPPTYEEIDEANKRDRSILGVQIYTKVFGSWKNALVEAGLAEPQLDLTSEMLINELRQLADELGHTPTTVEINTAKRLGRIRYGTGVYARRFGTITKAHEAAGLRAYRLPNVDDEQLLANLKDYAEKLGHTPTSEELNEAAKDRLVPYASIYVRRFGGLHEALKLAGLKPRFAQKGVTIEQVEEQLKALAEELGHPPTFAELKAASKAGKVASTSTIHNLGGRKAFYQRLGFEDALPKRMYNLSNDQIISQLQALASEIGRLPTKKDIAAARKLGRVASYTLIVKRFGTIKKALEEKQG